MIFINKRSVVKICAANWLAVYFEFATPTSEFWASLWPLPLAACRLRRRRLSPGINLLRAVFQVSTSRSSNTRNERRGTCHRGGKIKHEDSLYSRHALTRSVRIAARVHSKSRSDIYVYIHIFARSRNSHFSSSVCNTFFHPAPRRIGSATAPRPQPLSAVSHAVIVDRGGKIYVESSPRSAATSTGARLIARLFARARARRKTKKSVYVCIRAAIYIRSFTAEREVERSRPARRPNHVRTVSPLILSPSARSLPSSFPSDLRIRRPTQK